MIEITHNIYYVNLSEHEREILIHLICNEQMHMVIEEHAKYDSDKYRDLETLKSKIIEMCRIHAYDKADN